MPSFESEAVLYSKHVDPRQDVDEAAETLAPNRLQLWGFVLTLGNVAVERLVAGGGTKRYTPKGCHRASQIHNSKMPYNYFLEHGTFDVQDISMLGIT